MKIYQFWGREFMSLSMKKEYRNFPFSHDTVLKQNHIVIFISLSLVISVRIILGCINVFLDPQCIVSQEDLQHKILNG